MNCIGILTNTDTMQPNKGWSTWRGSSLVLRIKDFDKSDQRPVKLLYLLESKEKSWETIQAEYTDLFGITIGAKMVKIFVCYIYVSSKGIFTFFCFIVLFGTLLKFLYFALLLVAFNSMIWIAHIKITPSNYRLSPHEIVCARRCLCAFVKIDDKIFRKWN